MKNGAKPQPVRSMWANFRKPLNNLPKDGKDLLYVAFSSVLSGTYQSAVMARDLVLETTRGRDRDCRSEAAGIGERLPGHAGSSCA